MAYGFKIDDFCARRGFPSILEAARARNRHIELHGLIKAMQTHREIPSTFDARMPGEAFDKAWPAPLRLGETYLVQDGAGQDVPGVLCDALVLEGKGEAMGMYQLADGRNMMCTVPLSEAELAAYRRSPDTFFGALRHVSKGIKAPLDAYDFLFESYSKTSRELLLVFMATWPNIEALNGLSRAELAEIYCAEMATILWHRVPPKA